MSKFVTYPAVTMLDNDHSLLIDDPNAGTNSITAENAGNTLLSKWAGFETFDEAVQNTISNNQEFIDRDTAIREETAELKKKIVTTFPAKEASGAVATFESEFEDAPLKSCIVQIEPVQDLHGYDSPWPAGGGKNLLPYPLNTDPFTTKGITFTPNSDGSITINGTATGTAVYYYRSNIDCSAGTYVARKIGSADSSNTYAARIYDNSGSIGYTQNRDLVFTLSENKALNYAIYVYTGFEANNIVLRPMIELGSTASDWSPYSNICPISGWTGCEVQRTGKNLLRLPTYEEVIAVTDIVASYYSIPIKVKPSTSYYLQTEFTNGYTAVGKWLYVLVSNDPNGNSVWKAIAHNTADGGKLDGAMVSTSEWYLYLRIMRSSFNQSAWETLLDNVETMLSVGTTATPYEPYTGQTYPITFPSEAGTVYGGTLDVTKGELVVDRAMVTFDGTEDWKASGNYCYIFGNPEALNSGGSTQISSHYKTDYAFNKDMLFAQKNRSIVKGARKDVAAWKTYLAEQYSNGTPVEICYKLAEPIHYPLTAIDIKTLLGTNNIWADTGDVSVEYLMSDVSWYVEKKLRAFQSILAGVEDSSTASKNYSANTYLIFNDDIYKTTKAITAGETIEEGVNVTKTTVAEQLLALAQA